MSTYFFVLAIMISIPLGWEFITILTSKETISTVWKSLGHEWSPFIIYGVSLLPGHFWVQPPEKYTLAGYASEAGEVFVVLWIGWSIFWYFRANPSLTPLNWIESLALIIFGVLIGAFAWTMGF